ncbi:MAG: M48 family metalloprotease [Acidobacteriota bacterium]
MSDITDPRQDSLWLFRPLFAILLAMISLLATTGCVSTNLAPISVHGAAYEPLPDEIELWQATREEEDLLLHQVVVYDDPALQDYLDQLVARLESPGMAANREVRCHVTVLDDPTLHAFAFPHGAIYIHSGLLAQAQTEDHVAAILAHEMVHIENRHRARHERARWNRMLPIGVLTLGAALALVDGEADYAEDCIDDEADIPDELADEVFEFGLKLATRVSARGYGRRLEREADEGMVAKLRATGYDITRVVAFYDRLQGLTDLDRQPPSLAHGLGSDMARRWQALKKLELPAAAASTEPILDPPALDRLVRRMRGDRPL